METDLDNDHMSNRDTNVSDEILNQIADLGLSSGEVDETFKRGLSLAKVDHPFTNDAVNVLLHILSTNRLTVDDILAFGRCGVHHKIILDLAYTATSSRCPRCMHAAHYPGPCMTPSMYGCRECPSESSRKKNQKKETRK